MKRCILIATMVVAMSLLSIVAIAQNYAYLPIDPNGKDVYVKLGDNHTLIVRYFEPATPTAMYRSNVFVDGGLTETIAMRLSVDGDGNIYCHGGCWTPHNTPCTLDPPELMIEAPLEVGKTWETSCNSSVYGQMTFTSRVLRFEKIRVPAGTFECYLVERSVSTLNWLYTSYEWYSDKVGIVKFTWPWAGTFVLLPNPDTNVLEPHYGPGKTGEDSELNTWGGVKALYK